jgi:hypothetical protein
MCVFPKSFRLWLDDRRSSDPVENRAFLISHTNNMLRFRNDSGFLSNSSGQDRVFALYMSEGIQRASDYEQGQLISVGSGLNASAVAVDQSSRPACRSESRPGRERPATALTALNPTSPSTTGHRRDRTICRTVSVQISRAANGSSCDCATSPRTAARPHPLHRDYTRKE